MLSFLDPSLIPLLLGFILKSICHVEGVLCKLLEPLHEEKLDFHHSTEFNLHKNLVEVYKSKVLLGWYYNSLFKEI